MWEAERPEKMVSRVSQNLIKSRKLLWNIGFQQSEGEITLVIFVLFWIFLFFSRDTFWRTLSDQEVLERVVLCPVALLAGWLLKRQADKEVIRADVADRAC